MQTVPDHACVIFSRFCFALQRFYWSIPLYYSRPSANKMPLNSKTKNSPKSSARYNFYGMLESTVLGPLINIFVSLRNRTKFAEALNDVFFRANLCHFLSSYCIWLFSLFKTLRSRASYYLVKTQNVSPSSCFNSWGYSVHCFKRFEETLSDAKIKLSPKEEVDIAFTVK